MEASEKEEEGKATKTEISIRKIFCRKLQKFRSIPNRSNNQRDDWDENIIEEESKEQ